MYEDKFVVVVKVDGKILREIDGSVRIPFGEEYSLSFKNLENRKAVAKVEIDGVNVLGNYSLILDPGKEIDLERFITNSDLDHGNKFKFIKKTQEISDYRGDKIDDGLIRVEFRFEKELEEPKLTWTTSCYSIWNNSKPFFPPTKINALLKYDTKIYRSFCDNSTAQFNADINKECSIQCQSSLSESVRDTDDGITVKGSISNQGFQFSLTGTLEDQSHIIVMKLKGYDSNKIQIQKPITVRTKLQCETCGKRSRSNNKFCPKCGTSLI